MKKVIIIVITLLTITGCVKTDKKEIVSKEFMERQAGRFCGNYALAATDKNPKIASNNNWIIYKKLEDNTYEKFFETKESLFTGYTILTDEMIYFIYIDNGNSGNKISAYKINENHENIKLETKEIYNITNVYGIKDNYLYFSYNKWENRPVTGIKNISYARVSLDLQNFEEINKNTIPSEFDYIKC